MLNSRAIALRGVGYSSRVLALRGISPVNSALARTNYPIRAKRLGRR